MRSGASIKLRRERCAEREGEFGQVSVRVLSKTILSRLPSCFGLQRLTRFRAIRRRAHNQPPTRTVHRERLAELHARIEGADTQSRHGGPRLIRRLPVEVHKPVHKGANVLRLKRREVGHSVIHMCKVPGIIYMDV